MWRGEHRACVTGSCQGSWGEKGQCLERSSPTPTLLCHVLPVSWSSPPHPGNKPHLAFNTTRAPLWTLSSTSSLYTLSQEVPTRPLSSSLPTPPLTTHLSCPAPRLNPFLHPFPLWTTFPCTLVPRLCTRPLSWPPTPSPRSHRAPQHATGIHLLTHTEVPTCRHHIPASPCRLSLVPTLYPLTPL